MDFGYTEEQLELRERAAALARDIMAYEEECEAHRGLPAGEAHKRGLDGLLQYGAALPPEAGVHA